MLRVIWRYGRDLMGSAVSDVLPSLGELIDIPGSLAADLFDPAQIEPVFHRHPVLLRAAGLPLNHAAGDDTFDLAGYFHVFVQTEENAIELSRRLRADPRIAYAAVQPAPSPPVRFGSSGEEPLELRPLALQSNETPDFSALQRYLNSSPDGIDARFAWTLPGGRGSNIRIVDIESGWNFLHEDLIETQSGVLYGCNGAYQDHGTAVLGIFSGDDSGARGVTGISPKARAAAASAFYDDVNQKWNAAGAIFEMADVLSPGDIILLEMHAPGPNARGAPQQGYIPIEYWDSEFDAIRFATFKGIHIVEAAGNGGEDLDAQIYQGAFSRAQRDSGAILVGGGHSALNENPRSRIHWSNYGSRLDVQGWGLDVVTTGGLSDPYYCNLQRDPDERKCYSRSFGGTSGASPIVVGAVACISSALAAHGQRPLSPHRMRDLLVETGTPQTDAPGFPRSQSIGPLPNLRDAFEALGLANPGVGS